MIDFQKLPSPCFVLDEQLLDRNLAVIDRVRRESGAEVIVALKACAMWSIFPELAQHSDGATASSLAEARLVFEEFGRPAAGVSAVPMAARASQMVGQKDNPGNFLLMHAMGPNVAGVIGSAVAAGILINIFG